MKKPNHSDDGGTQNYDPATGKYAEDGGASSGFGAFLKSEEDRRSVSSIVSSLPKGLRSLCEKALASGSVSFRETGKNEFRIYSGTLCLDKRSLARYGLRMDDSPYHAPYFVFFHELGHAIDWTSKDGKRLSEGLHEMADIDLLNLEFSGKTALDAVNGFIEENSSAIEGAEKEAKKLIGSVSCAADIASYSASSPVSFSYWDPDRGRYSQASYGHSDGYWDDSKRAERCDCEIFANMVALFATTKDDDPARKFMKKTFPMVYKNFLRVLAGKEVSAWI